MYVNLIYNIRELDIETTITMWTQFVMDKEVDIGAKTYAWP